MLRLIRLLTGTLQTTRPYGSIALQCSAQPDQVKPKHKKIVLHVDLNQDKPVVLLAQHKPNSFSLTLRITLDVFSLLHIFADRT